MIIIAKGLVRLNLWRRFYGREWLAVKIFFFLLNPATYLLRGGVDDSRACIFFVYNLFYFRLIFFLLLFLKARIHKHLHGV